MPLREDIFQPIPGDNPGGADLYYTPLFDEIKEARAFQSDPAEDFERALRSADYRTVIEVAEEALAVQTKDLRLAQYLAEALIYERGFAGLNEGIQLFHKLVEDLWDHLYPTVADEEELEDRAKPLEWFGNYFAPDKGSSPALALRFVPLTRSGYGFLKYKESRATGYENDSSKAKDRAQAVRDGKLTPEEFDSAFDSTAKPFYKSAAQEIKNAREGIKALGTLCDAKFGEFSPSFRELQKLLEEMDLAVQALLKKKLEQDPDPIVIPEATADSEEATADGETAQAGRPVAGIVTIKSPEELAALAPADRSEAINRILAVAQYMRALEPQNPVPYLILRALRWGEVRSVANGNGEIDPEFLQAPPAQVRVALRRLAASGSWRQVLETAESAMGEPCGRGWLDLQRYSIQACNALGFTAAAAAMTAELRALLRDLPSLPGMTLSDDTGAANPATITWLNEVGSG